MNTVQATSDQIDDELNRLSVAIAGEIYPGMLSFLVASYQALCWARDPNGHAPPSGGEPTESGEADDCQ